MGGCATKAASDAAVSTTAPPVAQKGPIALKVVKETKTAPEPKRDYLIGHCLPPGDDVQHWDSALFTWCVKFDRKTMLSHGFDIPADCPLWGKWRLVTLIAEMRVPRDRSSAAWRTDVRLSDHADTAPLGLCIRPLAVFQAPKPAEFPDTVLLGVSRYSPIRPVPEILVQSTILPDQDTVRDLLFLLPSEQRSASGLAASARTDAFTPPLRFLHRVQFAVDYSCVLNRRFAIVRVDRRTGEVATGSAAAWGTRPNWSL
jgi:hypothetical protein